MFASNLAQCIMDQTENVIYHCCDVIF